MKNFRIKNKKGMALVVAIMTAFIMMALVASLFWVISATQRQAEYARNGAIALNLAEAGIADALYRLNYCTGPSTTDDAYPFLGTYIPFDLTSSDTVAIANLTDLPSPASPPYAAYGIKRTLGEGHYAVGLKDADPSDDTKIDTLISVGVYKGTKRLLTIPIRGSNDNTTPDTRQAANQGISEAFNKHVVYTDKITHSGAGSTSITGGNIVYTDAAGSDFTGAGGSYTQTLIPTPLFGIPTPSSTSVVSGSALIPAAPGGTKNFKDADGLGVVYAGAGGYEATFPGDPGGYSNDTYILNSSCTINVGEIWRFEEGGAGPLIVDIDTTNPPTINGRVVVYNGSMQIYGNATLTIGDSSLVWVLWVDEDINIVTTGGITVNGNIYCCGTGGGTNGIRITNLSGTNTINDWLISGNAIDFANGNIVGQDGPGNATGMIANGTITVHGGTIYGGIASGSKIELKDNAAIIDAADSDSALVVSSSGTATVTISAAPTLTLSTETSEQRAALTAFGTSTVIVTISADFQPDYAGKAARPGIAAYSSGGNTTVTINTAGTEVTGTIYSGSGGNNTNTAKILLENSLGGTDTITAVLVAGGTASDPTNRASGEVDFRGGELTFDQSLYTGADPGGDFYPGFSGGRRVYVPAWRVWGLK